MFVFKVNVFKKTTFQDKLLTGYGKILHQLRLENCLPNGTNFVFKVEWVSINTPFSLIGFKACRVLIFLNSKIDIKAQKIKSSLG